MTFTGLYFWVFFIAVYAVFAVIGDRLKMRNAFLFFASLFFYYKTSGLCVLILLTVITTDFLIARRIWKAPPGSPARKLWLALSVTIDLSFLCWFKYAGFLACVFGQLTGIVPRLPDIVLPVGISFFIFQLISYTVDVYRKDVEPVSDILDFGFYVSFFPQLVAGPIVRASEFIPQLHSRFSLSRRQAGLAVFWILNGLAKKVILGDYIASNFIDRVFENPLLFTGFENLAAVVSYSLQLYADFSGYTDIAIGVAMLMGFYLPSNFDSPYKSPNAQTFWRRWHMSLGRWLKSYLYIPLGGNRKSVLLPFLRPESKASKKFCSSVNRMITMLLGGLWHGASWNFVIWGAVNGAGMVAYTLWKDMKWGVRFFLTALLAALSSGALSVWHSAGWRILSVWTGILFAGTLVRWLFHLFFPDAAGGHEGGPDKSRRRLRGLDSFTSALGSIWGIIQNFAFITATLLFFRTGSGPASGQGTAAFETAGNMISLIGSSWDVSLIPAIASAYWKVFALVGGGFFIHFLPSRLKRRIRLAFASLPLPLMALIAAAVVFVIYQFATAGPRPFIYFKF